jgi:hypothetical protein
MTLFIREDAALHADTDRAADMRDRPAAPDEPGGPIFAADRI